MPKEFSKRQLQIGEEIRRLVAREINDFTNTRINGDFLTIMKTEVSKDLRYCKIFYRCHVANQNEYQQRLDKIVNDLTNLMYKQLHLRIRPEVRFVFDNTMKLIEEVEEVVKKHKGEAEDIENFEE